MTQLANAESAANQPDPFCSSVSQLLLFIYYAIRQHKTHKTHTIQEKIYTNKSYKML